MVDQYTKHSPKVLNAEGKPLVPGTYSFESIVLRRDSTQIDITRLCTDISFVEELFSPVMVAKISVADTEKIIQQEYSKNQILEGYEVLEIAINIVDYDETKNYSLKLTCGIREYGDFELDSEGVYSGRFTITAVDTFAILSRLKQVSFAVRGDKDPIEYIRDIFKNELQYDTDKRFVYNTNENRCGDYSRFKGVISYRTPLQAVDWLKTKAYDNNKSPFFVYSSFDSEQSRVIVSHSWDWLIKQTPSHFFLKSYNSSFEGDDRIRYLSEKNRVLEFNSNISKNELKKYLQGAYNSIVKVIDYSQGNFIDADDSYIPDVEVTLNGTSQFPSYRETFKRSNQLRLDYLKTLYNNAANIETQLQQPSVVFHKPMPLYDDAFSSRDIDLWHAKILRYYNSKMSNEQSELVVYGDLTLNPGKMINVVVDNTDENSERNGQYLIITSAHSFSNGNYANRLKIVRIL